MSDSRVVKLSWMKPPLPASLRALAGLPKKAFRRSFTNDPSDSTEKYALFTTVMAGSIALKKYFVDEKILPASV